MSAGAVDKVWDRSGEAPKRRKIAQLDLLHVERPVEKTYLDALLSGAQAVGAPVSPEQGRKLLAFAELLLTWNRKINLTAVTNPAEVVERHLIDSLAAVPLVKGNGPVVDLGAGGGLPGMALAIALPEESLVLADAVGKKVGFLKAAAAALGLKNVRAIHVRAEGDPKAEGIGKGRTAICRAFMAPPEWLVLAPHYVEAGGRILAMLGAETEIPKEPPAGLKLEEVREYRLPTCGAQRRIAAWRMA